MRGIGEGGGDEEERAAVDSGKNRGFRVEEGKAKNMWLA
jgi:hypothetical protein